MTNGEQKALRISALTRGISIHSVECVATFEEWDSNIGVFIFFPKDNDLRTHAHSGAIKNLETEYLAILKRLDYPFDEFPDVFFEFDSDENVTKNYGGSYFFRLR